MKEIVIDGKNATLGRLASYAAKQALLGHKITIVNCNEVVITGNPRSIIDEYKDIRQKGSANLQGPYFPRSPEKIVKRTARGMLPHRMGRGADALKRIICYNDTPEEYKDVKKMIAGKEKKVKTINLSVLKREI